MRIGTGLTFESLIQDAQIDLSLAKCSQGSTAILRAWFLETQNVLREEEEEQLSFLRQTVRGPDQVSVSNSSTNL